MTGPTNALPTYSLPRFDPAWLPAPLRTYAVAVARNLGVPLEMVALQALAVPSLLAGPYIDVEPRADWHEPGTLYVLTIADSGTGKSPAMRKFTSLIARAEKSRVAKMTEVRNARRAKLETILKGDSTPEEHEEAKQELATLKKSRPGTRLWVTDATDERLATLMDENGGNMAVWAPEPKFFRVAAGAYTKGGAPATDCMLQAYSGDNLRVERQTKPPVCVDRPRLTIAMMTQRKPVEDFLVKTGNDERGELARFLMCTPPDLRGFREPGPEIPNSVYAEAQLCADRLGRLWLAPAQVVALSDKARARFGVWEAEHQRRQRPGGPWREPKEWVSKMPGLVLRLAGLIHAAEAIDDSGPVARHVPFDALERGIAITEWGFSQACDVYRVTQENVVARKLDRLRGHLRESPGMLRSELWRHLKNAMGINQTRQLDELLCELETCGELKREKAQPGRKGGRPGERLWLVDGSGEGSES
jgi:hypothetical protein